LKKTVKIKQVLNSVNMPHTRRLLKSFYNKKGLGRKPYNPMSMLKAQLLKHLPRIPRDRRLTPRLKHDRRAAKTCGKIVDVHGRKGVLRVRFNRGVPSQTLGSRVKIFE